MSSCVLLLLCLCGFFPVARAAALNASLVDGVLSITGHFVGNKTSDVNNVVAQYFATATPRPAGAVSLKNSSSGVYSYLTVTGSYVADATISLTPQLILVLNDAHITVLPNFKSAKNAVISAVEADNSGVVSPGGSTRASIVCPYGGPMPAAVYAGQSASFVLDGISILNCGIDGGGSVHIEGLPMVSGGEIANCNITNSSSRAVWTEKCSRVVIHGNIVSNANTHTLDFDAFSSNSIAYNNTVSGSRQEAVFIEQGASYITVVDNDLGPSNGCGVAVYNNAINALTTGHVIARNRIFGNTRGVSVGSTAPRTGALSANVLVAGNSLWNNDGQGIHTNGGQMDSIYVGNDDSDGMSAFTTTMGSAKNISFSDPIDRAKVGSQ
jgi:hypothetical protein